MTKKPSLLEEIEDFLGFSGMAVSTFGHKTANDGKLVDRLRRGGSVTLPTAERIRLFIDSERRAARKTRASRPSLASTCAR